jgi:hypothetical protein
MAIFSKDYVGDFGVPGVAIEQTLTSTYDPYRGIDLTQDFCSYIEFKSTNPPAYASENDGIWFLPNEYPEEYFTNGDIFSDGNIPNSNQVTNIRTMDCSTDFTSLGGTGNLVSQMYYYFGGVPLGFRYYLNVELNQIRAICSDGTAVSMAQHNRSDTSLMGNYPNPKSIRLPLSLDDFFIHTDGDSAPPELIHISGNEACSTYSPPNSENYYISDNDKRPSLGIFSTIENNVTKDEFTGNLPDDKFEQIFKKNFIKNSDGRFVEDGSYYPDSLGEDSFKPQGGWGYISMDGVGINLTQANSPDDGIGYPNSPYQKRFIQHPMYNPISNAQQVDETITVRKFYWELLVELFNYLGYEDTDLGTATIDTCAQYFYGKYGMDTFAANNLCEELRSLDETPPDYPYNQPGNVIRMGTKFGLAPTPILSHPDYDDDVVPSSHAWIKEFASPWEWSLWQGGWKHGPDYPEICSVLVSNDMYNDINLELPYYNMYLGNQTPQDTIFVYPACASYPFYGELTPPQEGFNEMSGGVGIGYFQDVRFNEINVNRPASLTESQFIENFGEMPDIYYGATETMLQPYPDQYLDILNNHLNQRIPYTMSNLPNFSYIEYEQCNDGSNVSPTTGEQIGTKNCVSFTYTQSTPAYPDMYGYAGFYPYPLATDETLSLPGFNWATWVRDEQCYSYGRCLKFEAGDEWNDVGQMLQDGNIENTYTPVNIPDYSGLSTSADIDDCYIKLDTYTDIYGHPIECDNVVINQYQTTDSNANTIYRKRCEFYGCGYTATYIPSTPDTEILALNNQNQYRTLNQYQKFYDSTLDNVGTEAINQYSSLKVSFRMKTMLEEEYYDADNPPYVESAIVTQNPNQGQQSHPLKDVHSPGGEFDNFDGVGTTDDDFLPVYEILWGQSTGTQTLSSGWYYEWPINRPSGNGPDNEYYNYNYYIEYQDLSSNYSTFNNFNICSFKYFDEDIPYIVDVTKHLLNNNLIWPGDTGNTDQGGENPMMFDISLSGYPYYTPSNYLEYFENTQGVNTSRNYDMGGHIIHDDMSFSSNFHSAYWYRNVKPRQIGFTESDWASSQYGYDATPEGCAKYVRERILPFLNGDDIGSKFDSLDSGGFTGYTGNQTRDEWPRLDESGINAYDGVEVNDINFKDYMIAKYNFTYSGDWDFNQFQLRNEEQLLNDDGTPFRIRGPLNGYTTHTNKEITFTKYTVYGLPGEYVAPYDIESFHNNNYMFSQGSYNSIHSDRYFTSSEFGTMNRFKNKKLNTWEKFEYTFNLDDEHNISGYNRDIDDLYFTIQTSGTSASDGFKGKVYIDNFEIRESYDFLPDVDVRKRKGPNNYGLANLTKYYDPTILEQQLAYKDSTAPLEVQFYFYPKYNYNDPTSVKQHSIIYNDFRNELFYLYDVDWGDGTPPEFLSEPFELGENKAVYHTYETSGIFEIKGTMLRLKCNKDLEPIGVANNRRFVLRININEGLDEDFQYFGSDGFMFTPYKNSSPVIGGYSDQSIYYKTVKRQLGIVSDDIIVDTEFESDGDRLKTEIALNKMDSSYDDNFTVLNEFKKQRNSEKDGSGLVVYNGVKPKTSELGKGIGDTDLTNIRYWNKPKQIWEMLGYKNYEEFYLKPSDGDLSQAFGRHNTYVWNFQTIEINTNNIPPQIISIFSKSNAAIYVSQTNSWQGSLTKLETGGEYFFNVEENFIWIPDSDVMEFSDVHPGNPSSDFYWKKIIPEDYSIFERDGINTSTGLLIRGIEASNTQQGWTDSFLYQYPVLPKYGADGRFVDIEYDSGGNIIGGYPFTGEGYPENRLNPLFPLEGAITNEKLVDDNLIISIYNEGIESNVFDDASGNQNYAFVFGDYKPQFDIETLKPKTTSTISRLKTSTQDGAF